MNLKSFIKLYYPALLMMFVFLGLSVYAYRTAATSYELRREKQFEQRALRVSESIITRMTDYSQILRGCQALFYASDSVGAQEWRAYIRGLDIATNYAGIQGLAVSKYLSVSDTLRLLKVARATFPNYVIASPFTEPVVTPVLYIEPMDERNRRALGFDLYSEKNRRDALKRAIATGKPSITRKIKLRQEIGKNVQPGFLMFLPTYADSTNTRVTGFVSNVFRTYDLMGALLHQYSEIDVQLYDGLENKREDLIYEKLSAESSFASADKYPLEVDTVISVLGLPWHLKMRPNSTFGSTVEKQQPLLILAIGIIISILSFILLYNNIRRKIRLSDELANARLLERKKDEFISIASHELKTPLTSVKASVQILERSNLGDGERMMLSKARKNIDKLHNLIGDLLDISKIQAGQLQLNLEKFPLSELISDSMDSVANVYTSHKIVLHGEVPEVIVNGDKFRLEQALNNLLINAIKYSPASANVYLQVSRLNKEVQIAVIDEGIGISRQNLKKVFERFYRADEISPVISGLGLGLHISHEIIHRHGGRIEVQSELGSGSVFTIVLPVKPDN